MRAWRSVAGFEANVSELVIYRLSIDIYRLSIGSGIGRYAEASASDDSPTGIPTTNISAAVTRPCSGATSRNSVGNLRYQRRTQQDPYCFSGSEYTNDLSSDLPRQKQQRH